MSSGDIARLLAERAEDVCRYLLPNGRRVGREWKAGSVHGEAGDSLGVVLSGDKAGVWADFSSEESGDLVGLWKATRSLDVAAALAEAEEWLGIKPRANGNGRHVERRPEPSHVHARYGAPSRTWAYMDAYGGILGYVSRFDPKGERKQILPQTFRDGAWAWKGFDEPRPLYGLAELAARPTHKVLVVEGEKAADAARQLLPEMVVVTWSGGAQAVAKADLAPLRGRVLTLWPDADEPGVKAMQTLAERLGEPCRTVGVDGMPDGWDAADALAEGWDTAKVQAWAKPRIFDHVPRRTIGGNDGNKEQQVRDYARAQSSLLRDMPRGVHANMAENAPVNRGAADQGQRQIGSEHGRAERQDSSTAMQNLRGEGGDAPSGLLDPDDDRMAVSQASSGASRPLVSDFHRGHPDMLEEPPPDPIDLFDAPILPRLERHYLPAALATFILDQSAIIGSDPGILAISAMVSCAAVTHDRIKAQPKRYEFGWRESARLWGTFVGDPSVKKTPPLNRATAHLRKMNMQFAEDGAEAMARYKIAKKVYDAAERHYIDAQAKNKPTAPLYDPPERPPIRRVIVQDATIEALADILADNDGGVMVLFDELSGFFGSMDAYRAVGGKDRSFWLESYNGGPRQIDRVSREAMPVPNLSTNILGGIQPTAIKEQSKKMTDDGLLQRFMIVVAQPVPGFGEDRRPDQAALDGYREILDFLAMQRGDSERPLLFDDAARAVLHRVEAKLAQFQALQTLPTRMRYHLGKWSGLFVRLCLLYYAIECAALKMPVEGEIDGETAARVERFMFEYLFWHLQYFYEQVLGEIGASDDVTRVANLILAHSFERLTGADISRNIKAWRKAPRSLRDAIMDQLEIAGWIRRDPSNGRTGVGAWLVNPKVHEQFAERAQEEKRRREVAKAAIMAGLAERESE